MVLKGQGEGGERGAQRIDGGWNTCSGLKQKYRIE